VAAVLGALPSLHWWARRRSSPVRGLLLVVVVVVVVVVRRSSRYCSRERHRELSTSVLLPLKCSATKSNADRLDPITAYSILCVWLWLSTKHATCSKDHKSQKTQEETNIVIIKPGFYFLTPNLVIL